LFLQCFYFLLGYTRKTLVAQKMTTINADLNEVTQAIRTMSNDVNDLKLNCNLDEFDFYLAKGELQVFILKRCVEKLGYVFTQGSKGDAERHGREYFLTREETKEKISINLETVPSANHRFEILCNDAGQPIRNNVNYFVFMTYKFIYFVRPDKMNVDNPQIKTNASNQKFYEYDVNRARDRAEQIIQISDLVVF